MKKILQKLTSVVWVVAVAVLSSVVTLTVATVSAHGGDTNKVHSCVKNNSLLSMANVRIVGINDGCNNNETALDWPKTITPAAGSLSNVEVVWNTAPELGDYVSVNCPTGKLAIGGGVSSAGGTWSNLNRPIGPDITNPAFGTSGSASSATGWEVAGSNGVYGGPLTAYAICAKVN